MKLKNKKTGEIVYATMMASYGGGGLQIRYYPVDNAEDTQFKEYRSVSELNEEWEDYEEPEIIWYINSSGEVCCATKENYWGDSKEIGNYFEAKEEAEKAVERLKAWKRLKDKGFRVTLQGCKGNAWLQANWGNLQGDYSDVLLLFGGEE